jgi:ubiquinone/menaquinone biosynthesis C-methylase UbiE
VCRRHQKWRISPYPNGRLNMNDASIQRAYYASTAGQYDAMHLDDPEHQVALSIMVAMLDLLEVRSILDVGAGSGRVIRHLSKVRPDLRVVGVEPVQQLREVAYAAGVPRESLIEGDGAALPFYDEQFDLVCEFGMLHHVRKPDAVVAEMLRVAKRGVFISDSNNFGQGSPLARAVKQGLNALHLWPLANWIKTRGKGYSITEGDGLAYSYSVFTNYDQVKKACSRVHLFSTIDSGPNLYRSAGHVAMLGVK